MSSIGRPISGSITLRSASRTWSSVAIGASSSGLMLALSHGATPCEYPVLRREGARCRSRLRSRSTRPSPTTRATGCTGTCGSRAARSRSASSSTRLSLHPNTLRPHLRRLEEAGLVAPRDPQGRGASAVRRRSTSRSTRASARAATTGCSPTSWPACSRAPAQRGPRRRSSRASGARTSWAAASRGRAPARPAGPNLAVLQEAMAEAGFDPRFRAASDADRRDHRCATARSAICWTSIASSCARSIAGCSRGCSPRSRPCAWSRSSARSSASAAARRARRRSAALVRARRGLRPTRARRTEVGGRPGRWKSDAGAPRSRGPESDRAREPDDGHAARPIVDEFNGWLDELVTAKAPTCTSRSARRR